MKVQRGSIGIAVSFLLTLAIEEVGGQRHAAAALPPGMTRYTMHRRLCEPRGRFGQVRKVLPPPGFDPRYHPARCELLYRLSYPDQHCKIMATLNQ
jgi:hypothetical protein